MDWKGLRNTNWIGVPKFGDLTLWISCDVEPDVGSGADASDGYAPPVRLSEVCDCPERAGAAAELWADAAGALAEH